MIDLPFEIWDYIATFADREDLYTLALVSRALLKACRRTLFEDFILDSRNAPDHEDILTFLVDTELVTTLKSFSICTAIPDDLKFSMPIHRMLNLRKLFIGEIDPLVQFFTTADFQRYFCRRLRSCENLRVFSFRRFGFPHIFPHDDLPISGLEDVEWGEQDDTIQPAFFSLCVASFSTLVHLNVLLSMPLDRHEDYTRLFDIHFPKLESLETGPGCPTITGADPMDPSYRQISRGFAKFLVAHSTLKSLTLNHLDNFMGEAAYIPFDQTLMTSSVLQNLKSLTAYPLQVAQFAQVEATFFKGLELLTIEESEDGDMEIPAGTMFHALRMLKDVFSGALGVRHLVLAFNQTNHDCALLCKPWLDTCSEVFPNLETYKGETFRTDNLSKQFPHFQHLRLISCTVQDKHWRSDHARYIAQNCPSLKSIESYRRKRVFDIRRDADTGAPIVKASRRDGGEVNTEDEISDDSDVDFSDSDMDSNYTERLLEAEWDPNSDNELDDDEEFEEEE